MQRYLRQELFRGIGKLGQRKLLHATVAVVGVGSLGSHGVNLLTQAGVGKLILVDRDLVELHNLQSQNLYMEADVGKAKVYCVAAAIKKINKDVTVTSHLVDLDHKNIATLLKDADLILDCTDNLPTRFLLNDYCNKMNIPWIYAAVVADTGNVLFFDKQFCFRCLFNEAQQLGTCDTLGVLNSTVAVITGLQVSLALQFLVGKKVCHDLLRFSGTSLMLSHYNVKRKKNCVCCVQKMYEYLAGKKGERFVKLCGKRMFQIKGKPLALRMLKKILEKQCLAGEKLVNLGYCLKFRQLTIFADGRVFVAADDEKRAKSLYTKYVG